MSFRPQGYAQIIDPERARPAEMDSFTCSHCNSIVLLHNPDGTCRADVGVRCMLCMKAICVPCAEKARCDPFEKKLERIESGARLMRVAGG